MKSKHLILNDLIQKHNFKRYLEIGVNGGHHFLKIRAKEKTGIDPNLKSSFTDTLGNTLIKATSDDYFEGLDKNTKFDLIFIDGDHHSDQVERDIVNAWKHTKKTGLIVLHDIRPFTRQMQEVPRKQEVWTGDVWRAWQGFKTKYPKIKTGEIAERYGLGVIVKDSHKIEAGFIETEMTYEAYRAI